MRRKGIIIILLLVFTGGGAAFFLSGIGNSAADSGIGAASATTADTQSAATVDAGPAAVSGKQDNGGNPDTVIPPQPAAAPSGVPADTSGLAPLAGAVTAVSSSSDGSVSVSFYVQGPGYFTVQQSVDGAWRTLAANIYYPGTGGLPAATMSPDDQTLTLRLLRVEAGRYAAVTPAMTLSRAQVAAAGGVWTYKIP
ncbi:MAG: hypothetical protein ACYC6B_07025 [Thermoleophilia bacterium]